MKFLVFLLCVTGAFCDPETSAASTEQECQAGESFRRTAHYACHGYRDGKKADFVTCVRGSKYQFITGIQNCTSHFTGIDTTNEPAAAARMCAMHTNRTATPMFGCMANYFGTVAGCSLTGCPAATFAIDELDYDILKCYHQVYGTFPAKFYCSD